MQDKYRNYFKNMPCYLTVQDRNLKVIDANSKFEKDFGNWSDRYCYQVYKHRSEPCDVCPVEQTFRDGLCHSSEETVRSLDGKETSVIVYTSPVIGDSGEIQSVVEMSTDITNVKRLQSQFQTSQKRYQQLFNEVPCYVSIQDPELNIVNVNRRFEEDFGSKLGCKCFDVYKQRNEECEVCPVQQTFDDGIVHTSEEVVTTSGGQQMNVLVHTSPIIDSMGLISHVMEMSTDITPIRELQGQLESIGLLISSVSHGIKGLLNGLDGGMYLVSTGMEKKDDKRLNQGWEMVERNVERIRSQVLNILYYAKERSPNWEVVDAPELAREIVSMMTAKAEERGVEMVERVDSSAGRFDADPQAIRSLFLNLVENSLDACRVDTKKENHRVIFGLKSDSDRVIFEVSDNGIGMDQETVNRAFSLFFSSKGAKGTGLGLFIANKIARAHGGRIELESEPDEGSLFRVSIPRNKEGSPVEPLES